MCGRLAAYIEGPARVRLRVPVPLETEMEVRRTSTGVEMLHAGALVAEASPADVTPEFPAAPSYAEAEAAARSYRGFRNHPFPACFVCGPQRTASDGLRIFAGPLPGGEIVAAPWIPDASLGDANGIVRSEFVWAALDCPGAYAAPVPEGTPMLLGELAASLGGRIAAGERCIVVGWGLRRDGRRHFMGTALFAENGERRATARATWFEAARSPR